MRLAPVFGLGLGLLLTGCGGSGMTVQDFASQPVGFAPEQFFAGRSHTWGVLEDSDGNPEKTVTSMSNGQLVGNTVSIHQTITMADGTKQDRTWKLARLDAHHYAVTGSDIVGTGDGELYGNTLYMEYDLVKKADLPLFGNSDVNLHLRHWLYLQDDGKTLVSRTFVSKLGVTLARVAEYEHHDGT